jgi:AcrR family transcriptional regulator
MSIQGRRERERTQRERLIVAAARDLAEAEGWDAVTTRRLAELIEYSQPVLYSHFTGKDAIMAAVALEGFSELTAELQKAHAEAPSAPGALAAVARAYLDFAERRPALYDAMFTHVVELPFASPQTPAAMQQGFAVLRDVVPPLPDELDRGVLTEVLWAALHGLVTLTRGGRLPRALQERRLALLLERFAD